VPPRGLGVGVGEGEAVAADGAVLPGGAAVDMRTLIREEVREAVRDALKSA